MKKIAQLLILGLTLSVIPVAFAIVFLLFGVVEASAQDIIQMKDGSKMKGRIVEITETEVRFYKVGSTDLNTYIVEKKDVANVQYESGDVLQFKASDTTERNITAQEAVSAEKRYKRLTYKGGRFNLVSKDGTSVRLNHNDMQFLLKDHEAYYHYQQYRTAKAATWVSGVIAGGFLVGSFIAFQSYMNDTYNNSNKVDDAKIMSGIGLIVLLGGELPFAILTGAQGRKTAKVFNEYVSQKTNRYSLGFGFTQQGIGMVIRF